MTNNRSQIVYRTLWLSDIHLGNKACHAEYLLAFLQQTHCKTLYLVGDIIDILALRKRLFWPQSHYRVLKIFQKMAASGTRVIYIPGNHDAALRDFGDSDFLEVELRQDAIHETVDGRRLLVLHGDAFDHAVLYRALNRVIGHYAYELALLLNRWTHRLRRTMGLGYWSFANYLKQHVGKARDAIESFENAAAEAAKQRGLDGVVCGHIHKPELRTIKGVLYCNDGDWTESCSCLAETLTGELRLLYWREGSDTVKAHQPEVSEIPAVVNQ